MSQATEARAMTIPRELALAMLRDMVRIRRFEEQCAELYSAGKIRGFLHLYIGEEAVAVGVIGKPDPMAGEIVKAFVALKPGHEANEAMRRELLGHARKRLGAAVAPKEIDFSPSLPKTRSGKIMRRLLKARELGLPEGDTSTLEGT